MNIVKENLRFYRKAKKLNQQEVADKIGVTRQCYSNYEQGIRQPSVDVLRNICEVLECTADELIGIDN
jgi:transcriptional regulator with XRE-family HTH domain